MKRDEHFTNGGGQINTLNSRTLEVMKVHCFRSFVEHRCIFVHVPKTGGVSVAMSLFGNLVGAHATLRKYQVIFNKVEYDGYFKFAFVRNPWDRLLSAYEFLKQGGSRRGDKKWFEENLTAYEQL